MFVVALACAYAAEAAPQRQALIEAVAVSGGARQAQISWQSQGATVAQMTLTDDTGQTLLLSDSVRTARHSVPVDALQPGHHYRFTITASDAGRSASASGEFTTDPASFTPEQVSTASGVFRMDGGGFFPVLSWSQCAADVPQEVADGINTFMGTSCQMDDLAAAVAGKAYLMAPLADGRRYAGQIGWFQPDEADGVGVPAASLPAPAQDLPTLQTLTTHFAPQLTGDLAGDGHHTDYSGYFNHASSLGFDLYPAAEYCGRNKDIGIHSVFDLQQALVAAAASKPTYQWIETNDLEHRCQNPVSGALARAEAWLAVAGGADAIGWFTHGWPNGVWQHYYVSPDVQQAITQTDRELQGLAPALLAKQLPAAQPPTQQVKFGLRSLGGTVYVIAVNASSAPATGAVALPQLKPGTPVKALLGHGDGRVNARHALALKLAGYEVRVLAAVAPAA